MNLPDKSPIAQDEWLYRTFERLTRYPRTMVAIAVVCITAMVAGLGQLEKDTSVDALIPQDHVSFETNQTSKDIFGLADPVIVAVMSDSIFAPDTLALIASLHREIRNLPNVRSDRVISIASESSIAGNGTSIEVEPYLEAIPSSTGEIQQLRSRLQAMPPHEGTLISRDERGAIIAVELKDDRLARDTYARVKRVIADHDTRNVTVHVSGMAAVSGFLSSSIDHDSRIMQPICFLVVLFVVYMAFRRTVATLLPVLVIIASAGGALGIMAWLGVRYYTITSALPVILVAVSVADAIHILTCYYVRLGNHPPADHRPLVIAVMVDMTPPVTVTTLTTMAGFLGIALAAIMPPVRDFAVFAMLGVFLAWLFSVCILPNLILLAQPGPCRALASFSAGRPDRFARCFRAMGLFANRHFILCTTLVIAVILSAILGASRLTVDRALVEAFKKETPIRIADEVINSSFAGTTFLDVMLSASEPDGLVSAANMKRIRDLQQFMETLPHVQQTVAISDYLSLLHQAVDPMPAQTEQRPLPDADNAIAQYLLLYEASGDPADFAEEIDPLYQHALVRGYMNSRRFSQERQTVEALQSYVDRNFNTPELAAVLSGRANVRYHWLERLSHTHFQGVALSLAFVFILASLLFRSVSTGLIAVTPVMITILVVYAAMGALGIYLEPATSMFAAISLGVGVDFSIHLVSRFEKALRYCDSLQDAVKHAMPETSRACFYNALALGLGFSVLLFSDLLTLKRFGGLVAITAFASFLSSLVLVPFLMTAREIVRKAFASGSMPSPAKSMELSIVMAIAITVVSDSVQAEQATRGEAIARKVDARADGSYEIKDVAMTMTDRRGRTRSRSAMVLRNRDASPHKSLIVYLSPKSVRETAFLGYDYRDAEREDDQWLYLPALRKVRRIPSSDRGDYFLGTDFTYNDIQSDFKFDLDDYEFYYERHSEKPDAHIISGRPRTNAIADSIGYGSFTAQVDPISWLPLQIDFNDTEEQPLKRVTILDYGLVNEVWTVLEVEVENHATEHTTHFKYSDIRYPEGLPDRVFVPANLARGIPGL